VVGEGRELLDGQHLDREVLRAGEPGQEDVSRAKPKFQLASKDFPVAEPTFAPNTVPGTLPHWHDVGSRAPKPSTLMPFTRGVITMSLTLLVFGFVFAHVPNRAGFGVGGRPRGRDLWLAAAVTSGSSRLNRTPSTPMTSTWRRVGAEGSTNVILAGVTAS